MRLNKVAGIAASTFFTGALVLGLASTASAAPDLGSLGSADSVVPVPSCDVQVTDADKQGWTGIDGTEPVFTAEGLEYDNVDGHVEFYKPAASALSDVSASDLSYKVKLESGVHVPALQVRVVDAVESTWAGDSGFATLVWSPTAAQIEEADGDWITVSGAELAESSNWWITGPNTTKRTFAEIVTANPEAQVEHVGMTLSPSGTKSIAVVSEFTYNDCVSTFSAPVESEDSDSEESTDADSLGSLGGFGDLSGILANLAG